MLFRSSLVASLLALPFAHASISIGISCEQFIVNDGLAVKEICAEHQMIGPSPVMINGTVEYIGDNVDIYNILELELDDGIAAPEIIGPMLANYTDYSTGLIVEVTRFSAPGGGCDVVISGAACANCHVCDSTSISVDCSVVAGGRAVECEPLDSVFFPLEV